MPNRMKIAALALSAATLLPSLGVAVATSAVAAPPVATIVQTATGTMYAIEATNVRSGPGSKYPQIDWLFKGQQVRVTTTAKGWSSEKQANVSWSKLASGGWVRSDLLTSYAPTKGENYTTRTTKLRSGPGTDKKVIGTIAAEQLVEIVDRAYGWSDSAQDNVLWFKLNIGGWINAQDVGTR